MNSTWMTLAEISEVLGIQRDTGDVLNAPTPVPVGQAKEIVTAEWKEST